MIYSAFLRTGGSLKPACEEEEKRLSKCSVVPR